MNKRVLSALLVSMMVVGMLGGCGSKAVDDDSKNADDEVTIEILYQKTSTTALDQIIELFEKEYSECKVELIAMATDVASQVLQERLATKEYPDIILSFPTQAASKEMYSNGQILSLNDEEFTDQMIEGYKEMASVDGECFALTMVANAGCVIYNRDIFEENDLEVPETYDELIDVCKKLQEREIKPFIAYDASADAAGQKFDLQAAAMVSDKFDPSVNYIGIHDGSKESVIEDGYTKEAMERAYNLEVVYAGNDAIGTDYDTAMQMFAAGEGAMMISGTWAQTDIINNNPDMNYGMFGMPGDEKGKGCVLSAPDVSFSAMATGDEKRQEYSLKFLEFMSRPEIAQIYAETEASPSCIKNVEIENDAFTLLSEKIDAGNVIVWWQDYMSPTFKIDFGAVMQQFYMEHDAEAVLPEIQTLMEEK